MRMQTPLPIWHSHVYWHHKEQFMLPEDTYEEWVMFIIEHGRFRYRIGNQSDEAQAGDIVICPPRIRFHRETLTPLSFHFVSYSLAEPLATPSEAVMPLGKISLTADLDRFAYNNEQLRSYELLASMSTIAYREHIMLDIWFMAMLEWRKQLQPAGEQAAVSPVMRQAAELIDKRILSGTHLKSIATELGLTPVQFTRQFQAAYKETPTQYAAVIRLRRACRLLADTDWTLDAIAQECGYENGFYLSRMFLRHMKQRPSDYRRSRRL